MSEFAQQVTFLKVVDLEISTVFYRDRIGLQLVLDQGDCRIFAVTATAFLGNGDQILDDKFPIGIFQIHQILANQFRLGGQGFIGSLEIIGEHVELTFDEFTFGVVEFSQRTVYALLFDKSHCLVDHILCIRLCGLFAGEDVGCESQYEHTHH